MRVVGNIASDSEVVATASGAITAGKPVIVNADGTVAQAAISAASKGSVADAGFNSNVGGPYLTGLPGVSKFVAFARDQDNSYYGTAIVGVVSGSSISYGSASSTSHAQYENFDVLGLTSTTFVIVYRDSGDSNKGKARLGTVDASDNSITYGSVAQFEAGQTSMNDFGNAARLTDTTFVIAFEDASDSSKAKAIVGTVSGTNLSFGSPATFATANSSKYASIGALSSTKIVIAYSDTPSSPPEDGEVIVGTVSGTSISFGSATQYDASRVIRHSLAALSDTKFVIAYNDDRTGNNYATAIVGTVSGTNITLGSPVVFRASDESNVWPSVTKFTENDFVVAYLNDDLKPAAIKGSTSGTTITFGSSTELDSTAVIHIYGTTVNDEKIVAGFAPSSNLSAIVYNPSSANLTSENFIGFAKDNVADGAVATIQTANSIARDNIGEPTSFTYNNQSFALSGQSITTPEEIRFKPDGTKFYILSGDDDTVYQYSMSTAWDISTASYESKSFSSSSQEGTPQGLAINADGTSFYVCGQTKSIYQYNLSTAYDASTASYASKSFSVGSQITSGTVWSIDFNDTGTILYAISSGGTIYQYTLSTAFDIATASYASKSFDTTSQTVETTGIAVTADGTGVYVLNYPNDTVYKYTLSTPFDIATASYSNISFTTTSQDTFPYGVGVKTDDSQVYVTGSTNDSVFQYSVSTSLTIGQTYFVQTDGTLSTSADDPSVIAGTAISGTDLIVKG